MGKAPLLDVVEAAYDLDAPDGAWEAALLASVIGAFPKAGGALSFRYRLDGERPVVTSPVHGDVQFLGVPDEGHEQVSPASIYRAYSAPPHAEPTKLFHADPRTGQVPSGLHAMWSRLELSDMFGIYANRPDGESLTIGIALPAVSFSTIEARDFRGARAQWGCVARHLERALSIREAFASGDGVAAEFDAGGRGDFSPAAQAHRTELVGAARQLEAARSDAARDGVGGLSVWEGLLAGRWSIVRRGQSAGRVRFLAIENPHGDSIRALSTLERGVVERAVKGMSNKEIAFELGIHGSSTASILGRALRKLGIDQRLHLAHLAAVLASRH